MCSFFARMGSHPTFDLCVIPKTPSLLQVAPPPLPLAPVMLEAREGGSSPSQFAFIFRLCAPCLLSSSQRKMNVSALDFGIFFFNLSPPEGEKAPPARSLPNFSLYLLASWRDSQQKPGKRGSHLSGQTCHSLPVQIFCLFVPEVKASFKKKNGGEKS